MRPAPEVTATSPSSPDPAALPTLDGARPLADLPRRTFVAPVMGLPTSIHVRGPQAGGDDAAHAVETAFAALRADDATFSTWRSDSDVSRIRRGALSLADAGPRVRTVVALCDEAAARTDGTFSAWLPGPDGRPVFDPTGLVKGWAVEEAFTRLTADLQRLGGHDVLLSAGGDVVVACARTDTPDWRVGVEDPADRSRVLLTVPLRHGAVATSGTAARGAHIVDPATGRPAAGLRSATVVGPELTWADVYATAAFVRGPDAARWLATVPRHVGVLVGLDGAVRTVSPTP